MTPTQFRETHPWLQSREEYKRKRAFRRVRNRVLLAALAGSLLAVLAMGVT